MSSLKKVFDAYGVLCAFVYLWIYSKSESGAHLVMSLNDLEVLQLILGTRDFVLGFPDVGHLLSLGPLYYP